MKSFNLIVFISLLFSSSAFSCSCRFPDEHMEESDSQVAYVFIARPAGKNGFLSFSSNRFKFENITFLKGEPDEKVRVWSEKMFFGCGQFFNKKKEYVVFAYKENEKLYTSRCSSWVAAEYPQSTDAVMKYYKSKKQ